MKTMKKLLSTILLISIFTLSGCFKEKENEVQNYTVISTQDLEKNIPNSNWVVVDTRENDAYNGWSLDGIEKGGHIPLALDFSSSWLNTKTERLDSILTTKGITQNKNIVLYDYNNKDAKKVAEYLNKKGYKNIYLYNISDWINSGKTLESYKNYQMLVPPYWLKNLIDGKNGINNYKIFEVSWGDEKASPDYLKGHIPGAIHVNTDHIEEGPLWNRKSDEKLIEFAKNNGITIDTTVVVYGADSMPASRFAVILKYLGVKDVRLLNGGTQKWINAGYPVETIVNKATPVDNFGTDKPLNRDYIIDLEGAREILADKTGSRLVDNRAWDEFIGKTSGYDYIEPKGRPAGAVWGHAGTNNSNLDDYRNPDNTMRNAYEVLQMWKEWDITPDKRLSFYCGTGWRASEVLFYADVMGIENISLYDGGWNEWSGNTGNEPNPIETGIPVGK